MNRTNARNNPSIPQPRKSSTPYDRFFEDMKSMFVVILLKFIQKKFVNRIFEMRAGYIGQFEISMEKLEDEFGYL